jgi:RNA polymerase sigma factor (sigma-70 family)
MGKLRTIAVRPSGKRIRERRLALPMTQEQLAIAAGLSKGTIERVEAGKLATPGTLQRLAEVFGCEWADLKYKPNFRRSETEPVKVGLDDERVRTLREAIQQMFGAGVEVRVEVTIIKVQKGSYVFTLEMSPRDAERSETAFRQGRLAQFGVVWVRRKGRSESGGSVPSPVMQPEWPKDQDVRDYIQRRDVLDWLANRLRVMFRLRLGTTSSPDEDDATNETLFRLSEAVSGERFDTDRLRQPGNLYRFAYTLARRQLTDADRASRAAKRGGGRALERPDFEEVAASSVVWPEPVDELIRAEERAAFREAITSLPGRQRRVIEHRWAGFTNRQIAAIENISVRNADNLLRSALERLRELLS